MLSGGDGEVAVLVLEWICLSCFGALNLDGPATPYYRPSLFGGGLVFWCLGVLVLFGGVGYTGDCLEVMLSGGNGEDAVLEVVLLRLFSGYGGESEKWWRWLGVW